MVQDAKNEKKFRDVLTDISKSRADKFNVLWADPVANPQVGLSTPHPPSFQDLNDILGCKRLLLPLQIVRSARLASDCTPGKQNRKHWSGRWHYFGLDVWVCKSL